MFQNYFLFLGEKISNWATKANKFNACCTYCNTKFSYGSVGFQSFSQHSNSQKHKKNASCAKSQKKLSISNNTLNITFNQRKQKVIKAEILWALKTVQSNYSASSADGINELFSLMFEGKVVSQFKMSRKKLSYLITDAI